MGGVGGGKEREGEEYGVRAKYYIGVSLFDDITHSVQPVAFLYVVAVHFLLASVCCYISLS